MNFTIKSLRILLSDVLSEIINVFTSLVDVVAYDPHDLSVSVQWLANQLMVT